MQALTGKNIYLRALEPEDLDLLFEIENDSAFWEVSSTLAPFSRHVLQQYLNNAHLDIYEAKQLRLVIAHNEDDRPIGIVDLFEYSPQHKRAGVGILIIEKEQGKGYASEALKLLITYSFEQLEMHQLYANIAVDNEKSIGLFQKYHFEKIGVKKEWTYHKAVYKDVLMFQLINMLV